MDLMDLMDLMDRTLPVIDTHVIDILAQELHSYPDALDFIDRFVALLPERINAIHNALTRSDLEQATITLLSLHTSAAMVGATQLHHTTTNALATITNGHTTHTHTQNLTRQLTRNAANYTTAYTTLRDTTQKTQLRSKHRASP
ncbi:Hpt domain-containing protein [Arthrobacter sp. RIT-PI-e]|uniref:Hpt domain-containing protein n=1 Tax=Arthrobacter sp. RIT-PI-e TaxID=1681197 RepID=UPI000675E3E0|nr:Hpt domain-containing protein [Arthrobacter sp. RIT-PI-e]